MDTLEMLKGARELLSDVNKWAKGYYAFNAAGDQVHATHAEAVTFCAVGALRRIAGMDRSIHAAVLALEHCCLGGLANYNDTPDRTHAEILALFDATIAEAA